MSQDLSLLPTDEMVEELKKRNLSFIIAWADHLQFNNDQSPGELVWTLDRGGILPVQLSLLIMLESYMKSVRDRVCISKPGDEDEEK